MLKFPKNTLWPVSRTSGVPDIQWFDAAVSTPQRKFDCQLSRGPGKKFVNMDASASRGLQQQLEPGRVEPLKEGKLKDGEQLELPPLDEVKLSAPQYIPLRDILANLVCLCCSRAGAPVQLAQAAPSTLLSINS